MKKLILISTAAMMMTSFCASAKKEKQTKIVNPADMEIRREIAATPEKSGGIYYAYPYSTDSLAPVPADSNPFISAITGAMARDGTHPPNFTTIL